MSKTGSQIDVSLPKQLLYKNKDKVGILYFPELLTPEIVRREILKILKNPFYFYIKYLWVPTAGQPTKWKKEDYLPKHIALIKALIYFDKVNNLASRRSRKTTIASKHVMYSTMYYENIRAAVVTYKEKTMKDDILANICKMYGYLPEVLKELFPMTTKCQKTKTYIEFANGSRIDGYSAARNPEMVARGANVPIVYIDEAAFIDYNLISSSLLPAHEDAVRQVKDLGYPYFFLLTSTPNGREGIGKGYYENWIHSIPIELLYDFEKNEWKEKPPYKLYERIISEPNNTYNGFIGIKIHWSEFPYRDEKWAEERKRELNYYTSPEGRRKWYQEYELLFLGSQYTLFPDDILEKLKPAPPFKTEELYFKTKLKLWINEFDPEDMYIIGIDTAASLSGDFSAFEIYSVKTGEQIGEFRNKFPRVDIFIYVIKEALELLMKKYNLSTKNFMLAIENNSYGEQVVEKLSIYFPNNIINDTKRARKSGRYVYGINTNSKTKIEMVNLFYEKVANYPEKIHSSELINELYSIEQKGNRIGAPPGHHDDLFMASCLAHYGLEILRRERKLPPKILKYVDEDAAYEMELINSVIDEVPKIFRDSFSNLYEQDNMKEQITDIINSLFYEDYYF